ncbi:G2/mitotic-specific cyclin-B1-like [Galleria mellonella]|uniref:G2/mitotic-specific cyclin-B1-like n=1 Tax=Galleria mellonella TaxID=7137 RepID=A0A6J3C2G4_GALME|nr:G2/mitotic-specific cyclin-B1-like [Galleria mellonella]XP_031767838.2 G2/mitotic-specific cyclin-B1-like [Galleria mellonella]XP_031767839.2 G2/mitotic-specific cyclin-B1-like [Galleria mellonella]
MDIQVQRLRSIADQENKYAIKGKATMALPSKRQGLNVRGALGELNSNLQTRKETKIGKVAAESHKKNALNYGTLRNYSHVQPRVDSGLSNKNIIQPSSRPPIRRDENNTNIAVRAIPRTMAVLQENNKQTDIKNVNIQTKKQDIKQFGKLTTLRETKVSKPIAKEPIELLQKLKLVESEHNTGLINYSNLEKKAALYEISSTCSTPTIPNDIEDIDAGDKNSPLLMSVYIKDIYHYLTELEKKYPIEPDHLKRQSVITGKMRATLIDWLVEVQIQFSLVLETLHLTVGILDRYLQAAPNVQRTQLQLVGVTAMFIASKYEEIYPPDVRDFIYMTDKAYTKSDIFKCERDIMSKLGFCLARPIPLSFLRRFVKAAHGTSKNHHLAKYFVDLSLVEYSMAHYKPSELAAAAICLSLYLLSSKKLEEVWTPTLFYYSGYSLAHIEPIIRKLVNIVINVDNSKHKAVYNKYLDVTLAKVSSLPQLRGEAIYELAKISLDTRQ